MIVLLAGIYWFALTFALLAQADRICLRTPSLRSHRFVVKSCAVVWCLAAIAKWGYIDQLLPPGDALHHMSVGWELADALRAGDVSWLVGSCRPGNPAYQAMLGVLYAVTGAPEVIVYTINAALGFWAMLSLVELLALHAAAQRVPLMAILCCLLLPSAMMWTTTNLKEGAVLWGGVMMLFWTFEQKRLMRRGMPRIGLLVLALLRPHVAVMWAVSIGAAAVVKAGRYRLAVSIAVGTCVCAVALKYAAPALFETLLESGVTESLGARQAAAENHHSGVQLQSADRILVYTGTTLILFRPWPTEVSNAMELVSGAEVWCLALIGLCCWKNPMVAFRAVMKNGPLLTSVFALLCFGFYFSFMYNMGLAVRQRVMVLPVVLLFYLWPAFSGHGYARSRHPRALRRPRMSRLRGLAAKRSEALVVQGGA